jgi:hypothetical protein
MLRAALRYGGLATGVALFGAAWAAWRHRPHDSADAAVHEEQVRARARARALARARARAAPLRVCARGRRALARAWR